MASDTVVILERVNGMEEVGSAKVWEATRALLLSSPHVELVSKMKVCFVTVLGPSLSKRVSSRAYAMGVHRPRPPEWVSRIC